MSKIRLTEEDLHMLVEDAVKAYLVNEDMWGGLKNAWQGAFGKNDQGQRNYNFNLGQTYRSGNLSSSFNSYVQQAGKAIQGMQTIAKETGNNKLVSDLDTVFVNLTNIGKEFTTQASNIANGNRKKLGKVQNPWETQRQDHQNELLNQQNQYNTQLQNQQNQFNDQMQAQQQKYNRLNTRLNNYKKKYPAQSTKTSSSPKVGASKAVKDGTDLVNYKKKYKTHPGFEPLNNVSNG